MKTWLKRNLASGVVVIAPVVATAYVLWWGYSKLAALPGATLFELTGVGVVDEVIKVGVATVMIVGGLAVTGWLVRTALGVILHRRIDELANRIPGLRLVYNATQMAIETLLGDTGEFQEPVKLELGPARVTGFRTGNTTDDGRAVVFMPTSPNITSGYVIEVEEEDLEPSDETVEEALTRILSAGFGEEGEGSEDDDGRTLDL